MTLFIWPGDSSCFQMNKNCPPCQMCVAWCIWNGNFGPGKYFFLSLERICQLKGEGKQVKVRQKFLLVYSGHVLWPTHLNGIKNCSRYTSLPKWMLRLCPDKRKMWEKRFFFPFDNKIVSSTLFTLTENVLDWAKCNFQLKLVSLANVLPNYFICIRVTSPATIALKDVIVTSALHFCNWKIDSASEKSRLFARPSTPILGEKNFVTVAIANFGSMEDATFQLCNLQSQVSGGSKKCFYFKEVEIDKVHRGRISGEIISSAPDQLIAISMEKGSFKIINFTSRVMRRFQMVHRNCTGAKYVTWGSNIFFFTSVLIHTRVGLFFRQTFVCVTRTINQLLALELNQNAWNANSKLVKSTDASQTVPSTFHRDHSVCPSQFDDFRVAFQGYSLVETMHTQTTFFEQFASLFPFVTQTARKSLSGQGAKSKMFIRMFFASDASSLFVLLITCSSEQMIRRVTCQRLHKEVSSHLACAWWKGTFATCQFTRNH